jgi:hypothetical protein
MIFFSESIFFGAVLALFSPNLAAIMAQLGEQ